MCRACNVTTVMFVCVRWNEIVSSIDTPYSIHPLVRGCDVRLYRMYMCIMLLIIDYMYHATTYLLPVLLSMVACKLTRPARFRRYPFSWVESGEFASPSFIQSYIHMYMPPSSRYQQAHARCAATDPPSYQRGISVKEHTYSNNTFTVPYTVRYCAIQIHLYIHTRQSYNIHLYFTLLLYLT